MDAGRRVVWPSKLPRLLVKWGFMDWQIRQGVQVRSLLCVCAKWAIDTSRVLMRLLLGSACRFPLRADGAIRGPVRPVGQGVRRDRPPSL